MLGWYLILYSLSNQDITKVNQILSMPVMEVLDFIVIAKHNNEIERLQMKS